MFSRNLQSEDMSVIPERRTLIKASACRHAVMNFLEISANEELILILRNATLPANTASTVRRWLLGLRKIAKRRYSVSHIVIIVG